MKDNMKLFITMVKGEDGLYSVELTKGYCDGRCGFCRRCYQTRDILKPVNFYEADFFEEHLVNHQTRVAGLCAKVAEFMALERKRTAVLIQAALLHDIGKIFIPSPVFMKKGKLMSDEFEVVKCHAILGAFYLMGRGFPECVVEAVKHHHERYDGAGYPDGLKGDRIPFFARILAVCDAADAMLAGRHYRAALNGKEAIDELLRNSGSQFDPDVARVMVEIIKEEAVVNV
ncbi:HD-GYP domain-containing protein [Thermosediminibacter litoriperuensis]|uniref:Putative nucleotidyltransferase with HDIG domain n=1 Tax=Thermosediminibacter litoriperuensis TaxID=291989 RepID=A0A5S5AY33_9FIRM|nr:HD domain-containing phosphohydrolase [Thermosediminibacter litoriperuensis]TYP56829.1 putative nucleotidyltransferase with HDIG domain [Thermosediminibacter litoriperuensis]